MSSNWQFSSWRLKNIMVELIDGYCEHPNHFDDFVKKYEFGFVSKTECDDDISELLNYIEATFKESKDNKVTYQSLTGGLWVKNPLGFEGPLQNFSAVVGQLTRELNGDKSAFTIEDKNIIKGALTTYMEQWGSPKNRRHDLKLSDYILNVRDKKHFLNDLRDVFTTEKGKTFAILIQLLIDKEVLYIGEMNYSGFIREAQSFFKQDIGKRQGINHKENFKMTDPRNLNKIETKLQPLIDKHKQMD